MKSLTLIALIAFLAIAAPVESQLTNTSTRGLVLTGDDVQIVGFIVAGTDPRPVLIRARGPILADFGVPGELSDPVLQLFSGQTMIADNDDWETTTTLCQNSGLNCRGPTEITATGLDPCVGNLTRCFLESVIYVTLNPGPYTAIVSGFAGATGVGLVEVFEVGTSTAQLTNISTRGVVGSGDDVMIGGFIIGGTDPKTVLVRARGPVLTDFGVPGELANPNLQLFSGQTVIARNDNWQVTDLLCGSPAVTCEGATEIIATGLDPCVGNLTGCSQESAILVTLPPGPYTAIVNGVGGATGVGLVEVFEVLDISPAEGPTNTMVTIEGSGFTEDSRVTFGGKAATTLFASSTELVAYVPYEEDSSLTPLSAGLVDVEVNGAVVGSFRVTSLPANANPPGTVWTNETTQAADEFSQLRPQLEAKVDNLLATVTDPAFRSFLTAFKAALPDLEDFFTEAPNLALEMPPELLAVAEQVLIQESSADLEAPDSQPLDCATNEGDGILCTRKDLENPMKQIEEITKICGLAGVATSLVISPLGGAAVSGTCLLGEVVLEFYKFQSVPVIVSVTIVGPATLKQAERRQYEVDMVVRDKVSLKLPIKILIQYLAPIAQTLKGSLQLLLDEYIALAGITFPELPLNERTVRVSPSNFDWDLTNEEHASLLGPGDVEVVVFLAKDQFTTLKAGLRRDLRLKRDEESFQIDCHLSKTRDCFPIKLIPPRTLSVTKAGTGQGTVTGTSPFSACGSNCPASNTIFENGTVVTLTATPDTGSVFTGWSGACTGTASCVVTMDSNKAVTAIFNTTPFFLGVSMDPAGSGDGTVTSSPSGINCPGDCSELFDRDTVVTLTATPDAGSTFAGWSGACTGTGSCTVTMNADKAVTAKFNSSGGSAEFVTVDSISCVQTGVDNFGDKIFAFNASGTGGGPVGAELAITTNPPFHYYGGFPDPASCTSWGASVLQTCGRGASEPSSTGWSRTENLIEISISEMSNFTTEVTARIWVGSSIRASKTVRINCLTGETS